MSDVHFRIAVVEDATNIARLVNAAYRPHPDAGGWTHEAHLVQGERTSHQQVEVLIRTSAVLVGILTERVVACAHISTEGEEAHIGMLAVEPSLQAGGLGKALLKRAEEYASQVLGATDLILIVLRNRSELIAFYQRRGYQLTGTVVDYPVDAGVGTPIVESLDLEVLYKRVDNRLKA